MDYYVWKQTEGKRNNPAAIYVTPRRPNVIYAMPTRDKYF